MAIGIYGSIRSSDVSVSDIDIFYTFTPNRETLSLDTFRLQADQVLTELLLPIDEEISGEENLLGLYNLTLPATIFNQLGFYTIYIRPKTIKTSIIDCGVLSALPTVKGIILDGTQLDSTLTSNNALQGYRIEYINSNGTKLRNTIRYVTTNNKVIPVTENIGNTSQASIRYRFDDSGTLLFLQLTPSSASDVKPNVIPFIGAPNQKILMSNTNFNPFCLEVELTENTIDTIVDIVGGEQIKSVNDGVLTQYDKDRNIIKQFNLFEIKDDVGNVSLYEVKEKRTIIDSSQTFSNVVGNL